MEKSNRPSATKNIINIEDETNDGQRLDTADFGGQGPGPRGNRDTIKAHTPLENLYYKMDSEKRGYCIIFNNKKFHPRLKMKVREGTDQDREDIALFFSQLNFIVKVFNDLTWDQLKSERDNYVLRDHSQYDCLVVFFLSHGGDGVLYAQDRSFDPDELFSAFDSSNCKTLAGKPKMFFIQACRGGSMDKGIMVEQTDSPLEHYLLPTTADTFTMWSTVPGYCSWRNATNGSWFIQSLLLVLRDYMRQYDLAFMHSIVNKTMISLYQSNTPGKPRKHGMKQVSSFVSTATHALHFFPPPESITLYTL